MKVLQGAGVEKGKYLQARVEEVFNSMQGKLQHIVPEIELRYKAQFVYEIARLKREKQALILGHNYMEPALFHTVPDFQGDSLYLCRQAAATDKPVIIFCGVRFMAETAKILNPDKLVLLPSLDAGCSLAASITAEDVRTLKRRYPGVPVVTYINTYAAVKAESDICCTSGNARQVVESLKTDTVIFLPDEYLAGNVARESGKHIVFPTRTPKSTKETTLDYAIIGWEGKCEVHEQFTVEDIENVRRQFPDVLVLAHPECSPEVVAASDYSGSTQAMIQFVERAGSTHYLLLTECSMGDNIAAEHPEKEMVRLCSVRCPHMNEITVENTLDALLYDQYPVELPEEIRRRAEIPIRRMLEIG